MAKTTTVVVFKADPWSGYLSTEVKAKNANYIFIMVDATHDDIWLNPERYVEIIQESGL